eukprot:TRINITY_DN16022_c0_g1_i1.p1 TRINITY_DN16022_c0_g1~~TRINITY_DN16022_c0_g1_i1.p1  ORF type:complete len:799 (-),score=69.77 TRINITY_DN16022_c0_g1_i1:1406-3802(-)
MRLSRPERDFIHRLPDGVLTDHIFPRISNDVCSFVCRRWRDLEKLRKRLSICWKPSGGLVKNHDVKAGPHAYLPRLTSKFPAISDLSWREEETGCFGFLDPTGLALLARGFQGLQTLCLANCVSVTDEGVAMLALHCRRLQGLRLEQCPAIGKTGMASVGRLWSAPSGQQADGLNRQPPQDGFLEASAAIWRTAQRTPMKLLQVIDCKNFGEKSFRALLLVWGSSLTSLHVADCGPFSDSWLASIVASCRSLEDLWLCSFRKAGPSEGEGPGGLRQAFQQMGLRQHLAQFWAQVRAQAHWQAQAHAFLGGGAGNQVPPPPLPAPPLPIAALFGGHNSLLLTSAFSNAGMDCLAESPVGSQLRRLVLHPCSQVNAQGLASLARGCPNLRHLSLERGIWDTERMEGALQQIRTELCPRLLSLTLTAHRRNAAFVATPPTVSTVSFLLSGCTSLTSLSLAGVWIGDLDGDLVQIFQACGHSLKTLRLWHLDTLRSNLRTNPNPNFSPNLNFSSTSTDTLCKGIGNALLTAIGTHCPNLIEFWLDGSPRPTSPRFPDSRRPFQINEAAFRSFMTGCHQLKVLRLAGISSTCPDSVFASLLASSGSSLTTLDVSNTSFLIGPRSVQAIGDSCQSLTHLRIGRGVNAKDFGFSSILLHCKKLSVLSLTDVQSLTNEGLVAAFRQRSLDHVTPRLSQLTLSTCSNITSEGIEDLIALGSKAAPLVLELNEQKGVVLDVECYARAHAVGCTICNMTRPERGSMACDVEDGDWRTRTELLPPWNDARDVSIKPTAPFCSWQGQGCQA